MVITFHSDVWFGDITHLDTRNWTTEALEKFEWSKVFTQMSDSGTLYIEMLEIEQRKLSTNSNGHNFSHGCPIQAYNMSSRSKLNNESSREIQMVITFHSDVWFRRINIQTLEIEQRKLSRNSNGHNFLHWGPIQDYNISRRSKLNNESSWEIKMVICFHTKVRFRLIICRVARNWTTKAFEKSKWS